MISLKQKEYDVVIMGAGFAGISQARHLLLNVPNIRIALVDPRPENRTEKDLKIGESTVEISAMFLTKELGLHEYLIENHAPKYGLNFHWPKNPSQTENTDDYYHVWGGHRSPAIDSFHINRAKFEQDVLKMVRDMGATFYNGRVVDIELTPKNELHTVNVKLGGEVIELQAKHLIDTTGRRFIIGKKTDNLVFDSDQLCGINTGSSWVRVKNIDPRIFDKGYNPLNGSGSRYYSTNHWLGHGHWIWMLPIDTNDRELSIGVVHHKNTIPANEINTIDKFKEFLKANHTVVYNIIESGDCIDFNYLPRLAHTSKKMLSEDNWYVIGDAAQMFDPFYSPGLVLSVFAIESATEVIRSKLAGESDAEQKQFMYNKFLLTNSRAFNNLYKKHEKILGNASVMSWRLYMEIMFYFGLMLPTYVGKWFLDFNFISNFVKTSEFLFFKKNSLFNDFYQQLEDLVDSQVNIGLMDFSRTDQLILGYEPRKFFDDFLQNTKFEPLRCNVYVGIKSTFFFVAILYIKLQITAFGIWKLLDPRRLFFIIQLLAMSMYIAIGEQIYKFQMRKFPKNSYIANMREDFKTYQYQSKLQPWLQK
ncbi:tryptophan halogenase [Nodularia sp. UHCC 0506]|uniref:NAD(P)/FAD-dependent oxidoreductase n=1 Tax=Nodularia sp. UHCC 0506 TaxID=3110243 RepID=UPI002B20350B|nr:tryptophan halogenase [Nodularia sp. UHCC 0506]MEA5516843.1 tryptophan halogenase [Nodularia sp. UHCC 0506]